MKKSIVKITTTELQLKVLDFYKNGLGDEENPGEGFDFATYPYNKDLPMEVSSWYSVGNTYFKESEFLAIGGQYGLPTECLQRSRNIDDGDVTDFVWKYLNQIGCANSVIYVYGTEE